ncbi:MAG: 16S rRNA (guanine(527)-N(7))-methyltransferase RsmG [Pseudomonadota bacterium]
MTAADRDGFGLTQAVAGFDVSRETSQRLALIVEALAEWRGIHNLIGPREMDHIWRRHVFDSLQLWPHIPAEGPVVDLGSGAGFPGLVIAACLAGTGREVTLIESVRKKCAFLRDAIARADLPARVCQARVEATTDIAASCITARAFAPLPKLFEYASPWLLEGVPAVLPKGKRWQEELTRAQECWKFAYDVIPSQSGEGVILIISEVSRGG